jgi:hypothetical protein
MTVSVGQRARACWSDAVLKLLQPPHLRRLHAVVLLLPIEVSRLADSGLPADLCNRYAVLALLQNERFLRVRELRGLHRLPLLPPAKGKYRGNSNSERPSFRGADHARLTERLLLEATAQYAARTIRRPDKLRSQRSKSNTSYPSQEVAKGQWLYFAFALEWTANRGKRAFPGDPEGAVSAQLRRPRQRST